MVPSGAKPGGPDAVTTLRAHTLRVWGVGTEGTQPTLQERTEILSTCEHFVHARMGYFVISWCFHLSFKWILQESFKLLLCNQRHLKSQISLYSATLKAVIVLPWLSSWSMNLYHILIFEKVGALKVLIWLRLQLCCNSHKFCNKLFLNC